MASKSGSVWAIDLGNNSLKALHLSTLSGVVEVVGFDNIQHGKVLDGAGVTAAERDELIAISLHKFTQQNDLGKDDVVVSVPSQNSFARFVNLPPVEPKRIPEIIKFEAAQQIPFDIDDVQWDWQLMTEPDGTETKVGIFAIKDDVVSSALEHFGREEIRVSYVQMAPMALYNCALYDCVDLMSSDNLAVVVLDIGAENTDLVVCTRSTVWQRCIPMGGNAFTGAIADAFKLNFEKAEKLKRTAPMSKYARQIFQAMKPVFSDLAAEIQRSLGFYNSSNPDTKLSRIIAFGGGTRMRGLLKYLQQTLRIPVERLDSFKKLAMGPGVSAAKFHENVNDFGIVYGLALQGLGLAQIESNLLPHNIARSMAWARKAKYFTVAACMLLAVSLMGFARTYLDGVKYAKNERIRNEIRSVSSAVNQAIKNYESEKSKGPASQTIIEKAFEPFEYREVVPLLHETIFSVLPSEKSNPEQKALYEAFANREMEGVKSFSRQDRKQIFITGMSVEFSDDVSTAKFGTTNLLKGRQKEEEHEPDPFDGEFGMMPGSKYRPDLGQYSRAGVQGQTAKEGGPGFVVTIVGYSPYKDLGELMDPTDVEDDPSRWGFVTRLEHLDDIVDGNSPFKLYGKGKGTEHFKLEINEVDLGAGRPPGIGIVETLSEEAETASVSVRGQRAQEVLVDPMTKEVISKVPELDEKGNRKLDRLGKPVYRVNDHWFVVNLKFVWKDAPEQPMQTGYGARRR